MYFSVSKLPEKNVWISVLDKAFSLIFIQLALSWQLADFQGELFIPGQLQNKLFVVHFALVLENFFQDRLRRETVV
jgi:hypothetical protein